MSIRISTLVIRLSYDGSPFCGFARQPGLLTVQGDLENALSILFRVDVPTVCAGRTDSGVHALDQVVSAEIPICFLEGKTRESIKRSLEALTHKNVRIQHVYFEDGDFSARFDAKWREYRYRLAFGENKPLFTQAFTWWIGSIREIDIPSMESAAQILVGHHDFKSFCIPASAEGKNTIRNLHEIEIYPETIFNEKGYVIKVVGDAFLHSMIRILVGTLVEVGSGRRKPEWVEDVLLAENRKMAGPTAPACGLTFWHVEYPSTLSFAAEHECQSPEDSPRAATKHEVSSPEATAQATADHEVSSPEDSHRGTAQHKCPSPEDSPQAAEPQA